MRYENYESDCEVVIEELEREGIKYYTLYPANNCVGVSYGRVSAYYTVRDGVVVEKMID